MLATVVVMLVLVPTLVVLVPVFVSPVVLGFGYVVSIGPVGFFSIWTRDLVGGIPWNLYSLTSLVVISGLTHVPYVYLYTSSALRAVTRASPGARRLTTAYSTPCLGTMSVDSVCTPGASSSSRRSMSVSRISSR